MQRKISHAKTQRRKENLQNAAAHCVFAPLREHLPSLMVCLLVFFILIPVSPISAQDEPRRIGSIDFFGYTGEGDLYLGPAQTREAITQAVKSVTRRLPTDVAPVCCDAHGNYMIFIGLPGFSGSPSKYNPVPNGKLQLPPATVKLYDETMDASSAAVLKGNAQEDESKGYALSTSDSTLRDKQLAVRAYATRHEQLIIAVLQRSSEAKQRIVAAHLLGYARQSSAQIANLVRASNDADEGVRNNATRALGVLAESSPRVAARIPAGPFIKMINSGSWTDRNKAAWVLSILTRTRNPKLLAQLRSEAVHSLIEMARWRTGHAQTARIMVGRIGGIPEERLIKLVADNPEAIISTVILKR